MASVLQQAGIIHQEHRANIQVLHEAMVFYFCQFSDFIAGMINESHDRCNSCQHLMKEVESYKFSKILLNPYSCNYIHFHFQANPFTDFILSVFFSSHCLSCQRPALIQHFPTSLSPEPDHEISPSIISYDIRFRSYGLE